MYTLELRRALALWLAMAPLAGAQVLLETTAPASSRQEKSLLAPGSNKLDPRLRRLMQEASTGSLETAAKGLGVPATDERVSVQLTGVGADLDALRRSVEDGGGEVETTFDGVLYARVPLRQLSALGNQKELAYAGPQAEYELHWQAGGGPRPNISEGIDISRVRALHGRGITGRGVKVGIIDGGFFGYKKLQADGKLPQPKKAIAFNERNDLENDQEHGTGCAEIIHQMAPSAELYLASVDMSEGRILQAAQWMIEQGVDVINFSIGGVYRGDGMDKLSRMVEDSSRRSGIVWLVSAGNEGDAHWLGSSQSVHSSGFLQTAANSNAIKITAQSPVVQLVLRWDDWGSNPQVPGATQDLDMYVYTKNQQGEWAPYLKSVDEQNGSASPVEVLRFRPRIGQEFLVAIKPQKVTRALRVHLFASGLHTGPDPKVQPGVKAGSIGSPALTRAAVAVGAVDVRLGRLSDYSSQGPTDDGRVKPEVTAPDNTTSEAYAIRGGGRFPGTSAAAPHATGFAALIKQANPQARADALRAQIVRYVRPMGAAAPNNEYGFGHIDGSALAAGGAGGGTSSRRTLTLPKGWGGEVNTTALEGMSQSRNVGGLEASIAVGKREYTVGDGMKIGYKASDDCYYLLINRDARGDYSVVAPMDGESERLVAGEKYVLPRGEETIRITGPGGEEAVILIISRERINLNEWRNGDASIAIARYEVKPQ